MSEDEFSNVSNPSHPLMGLTLSRPEQYTTLATLKRSASSSFEGPQVETSRKRMRGNLDDAAAIEGSDNTVSIDGVALADDLAQELQCGCCSELV